jgi:TrmH family RNA methyltransferase
MPELIVSRSNPLVKLARSLHQKKGRAESGLFLVEGIHHVGEALAAGWQVEAILYAPDQLTSDFGLKLVDEQSRRGVRVAALTRELFAALAEKDNPQGLLALVRQRTRRLEEIAAGELNRAVACVSPQDPGNIGSILRSLDAAGADGLFLLEGGADPFQPAAVRASMGTLFWKPVVQTSFLEFETWARRNGYQLIGTSAHASLDYRRYRPGNGPWALLLGSEQKGLTAEQGAACDVMLSVPMHGKASSLNLAVAAGILLYSLLEPAVG